MRPSFIKVSLWALRNNFLYLKKQLQASANPPSLMAVIKANAYGHGLIEVAKVFSSPDTKADYLGVAFVEEGVELRKAGITLPILVFGGIFSEQIKLFLENNLELTASSISKLKSIEEAAASLNKTAKVHLKIDTGMERIGVHYYNAADFFKEAVKQKNCEIKGIFSHFASAGSDPEFTKLQLERFKTCKDAATQIFKDSSLPVPKFHLANSAATLTLPESHFDIVRCGISLYGVNPGLPAPIFKNFQPAMELVSKAAYFKVVKKGAGVSYGQTWHAEKDTRVITVPIGYGDGYFRSLSNKAEVIINEKRYPVIGRVCMDQIMVDIGDDSAYVGDEVVLLGKRGDEQILASELASKAGSYSYEVLTALNNRLPRVYG